MADFGGKARVAGEERLEVAVLHQEHERVLVDVLAPLRASPASGWSTVNRTPSRVNCSPVRAGMPRDAVGRAGRSRNPVYRGSATSAPGSTTSPVRTRAITDGSAAEVVGVGVGDDGERERPGAVPLQERRDHPSPGIAPLRPRARHPPAPNVQRGSGAPRHRPARRRENVTRGSPSPSVAPRQGRRARPDPEHDRDDPARATCRLAQRSCAAAVTQRPAASATTHGRVAPGRRARSAGARRARRRPRGRPARARAAAVRRRPRTAGPAARATGTAAGSRARRAPPRRRWGWPRS